MTEEKPKEAPKKLEATDASEHPWVRAIRASLPDTVLSAKEFAGQVTVTVAREAIARVARHLKEAEDFKYCVDVTAVDWKTRQPRFDVVYHFYSFSKNGRIRIKCPAGEGEEVPSIATIFLAANWCERTPHLSMSSLVNPLIPKSFSAVRPMFMVVTMSQCL